MTEGIDRGTIPYFIRPYGRSVRVPYMQKYKQKLCAVMNVRVIGEKAGFGNCIFMLGLTAYVGVAIAFFM